MLFMSIMTYILPAWGAVTNTDVLASAMTETAELFVPYCEAEAVFSSMGTIWVVTEYVLAGWLHLHHP